MMRNISLTRKDAQLVEITLDDDSKIKCTPDHRIMLRDGSYKEAKDLVANESLKPFNSYISNKNYRQIQSGTKRDRRQYRMIAEYNNLIVDPKTTAIHHNDYDSFNDSINNLVIMSHEEHRKLHAERMMGKNNPYHKKSKEWQSKMASHPGEKNGRYSGYTDEQLISLMIEWIKERNYPMSGDDWRRLAKENGYPQYFTSFRKSLIEMLEKANASCGFNFSKDKYKQREYRKKMMATAMINHKVKSVKYIHSEDVYDGTVDDVHNFAVITSNKDDKFIESSGVFVHNCGEIVMPRYSICCLSSTNLASFVKNKFEDNAYFDFDEFGRVVRLGVRFLDNILSVAKYPLKKIEENALGWRRIGLGFTALGNAFQYMKMSYGSEESKELSEKIAQVLRDESYRASADLAKEKGKFPFYDDQINEASFIKQLPDDIRDEIREHGLRNIALNTTAPNGTISLSVGQNCVKGDTEVSTLEGKIKIKDLVGKNPYVYCVDDDGNPAVRKAKKVWLSRKDAPVVKVVFDDDSSLVCTEDHEIRLSSGEYVKAKDLKFMDSVTAFYKQLVGNGGRDIVTSYIGVTGNSNRSREHRVVAEMMLGRKLNDDEHVHHIDEDRLNNLPENLEILNPQEHAKKHNNFNKLNKLRKGMSYEEIYGKEQAAEIKEKKSKIVPWNKGRKHSEETKKKISKALSNHKVKEIIFNYDVCDVYDMEVEEIHNFVANGIVIHNCSSGIEPTFALSYTRNYRTGTDDEMASEAVYDKAWLEFIEHSTGKEVSGDEVKFDKPDWFTVAADVDPYDSIDIQAIFQKYIDHSISKTLNLPPGTTQEQYNDLFMYAYDNGLKGFTTFNPEGCGSPDTRVLTTDGIKTFGEIFEAEDIDIYDEQNKGWVDLKNDLEFYDENGNTCKINKAFIKGLTSNMLNITLESGETLCVSPEHKFMINGEWIEAKNLKEGDDLDVYQGELGKSQKTS
jgi:intein/homing endonuclease